MSGYQLENAVECAPLPYDISWIHFYFLLGLPKEPTSADTPKNIKGLKDTSVDELDLLLSLISGKAIADAEERLSHWK